MTLIEGGDFEPGANVPALSVSEISGAVKRVIEGEFARVRVRGEVGRVSRPRSGHVYLDLKDDRAVLAAVIWKGVANQLANPPEEGMEVIATGRLTTFAGQSRYQLVIDEVAPAGLGALMAMLEKRRQALAAEGLFDAARKRPLPFLPGVIGVVTSPSGAVIRDILHRLAARFPRRVILWPVAVQGAACAPEVAAAIRGFNALPPGGPVPRPDLIIVARGGGSIEDLWGFNEEIVVRAAADSAIPLISAVGHETDTTLIDHAADRRAPTPTAAAEMAVPVRLDLLAWSDGQGARLRRGIARQLRQQDQRLRDLARALPRPETLMQPAAQRLDLWGERLPLALRGLVQARRLRLSRAGAGLRLRLLTARLEQLGQRIGGLDGRLAPAMRRGRIRAERDLAGLAVRLRPDQAQRAQTRGCDAAALLGRRLDHAMGRRIAELNDRIGALERLRQTLGYRETLRRGYCVVRGGGQVVTTRAAARTMPELEIEFQDGRLLVSHGQAPPPSGGSLAAPRRRPPQGGSPPDQGSLF